MKKIIIIAVVLALIVGAGITTMVYMHNRSKGSDLLSQLETDDVKSKELKETTLTFYLESQEPQRTRQILDAVEQKAKSKLNVKLDFKFIYDYPQQYLDKLKTTISSGQPCDAFLYYNGLPESLKSLAGENVIKDLTQDFPKYAPEYFKKYSKEEIMAASVGNSIYAIPAHLPTSQIRCALVRDDLMKKYNIPDIKSYDDYENYLKTIKSNEPGLIPMNMSDTTIGLFAEAAGYVILDYTQGLVYKWDDPDMKIIAWEQTPEFKKGIETLNRWYSKSYMLQNTGTTSLSPAELASGKWGSIISIYGEEFNINGVLKNKNLGWTFKAYPLYPDKVSQRNSPLSGAMVVSAKSPNCDRLLMFLEWLQSSQENYDSIMYGEKDKDYILEGDRVGLPENASVSESYLSWQWRSLFANVEKERVNNSMPEDYAKEYYKTIMEKTKYPPHTGFVPDYGPVSDIAALRQYAFTSKEQKIYSDTTGVPDVDSFIKDQRDNGADKLVQEIQRQLDKWRADNGK